MNLEEARDLMIQCQRDRVQAQVQMTSARVQSESATLIIQGLLRRFPELRDLAPTADSDWEIRVNEGPSGADAVLQILQVDEGQLYTVRGMVAALDQRGWLPQSENPPNAVRTALERLRTQNKGVYKEYNDEGVMAYCYREPEPSTRGGYAPEEEPF